jgi:UrcA family protein
MLKALSLVGALALASALLLPTASLARTANIAGDDALQTAWVSYSDLDLSSLRGANVLQARIKNAAQQVCGTARPVELDAIKANRLCSDGAIASAKPAFDQAIAAAHRGSVTVIEGSALIVTAPIH